MNPTNQLADFPAEPKGMPNWVEWKLTENGKEPFIVGTNRHAKVNDPGTWTTFEAAIANTPINGKQGIGCVIGGQAVEAGIIGLDFDGCRNPETGEIAPWAEELIEATNGSYAEYTPSGCGIRVLAKGKLPSSEHVFELDPAAGYGGKVKIECYDRARFFTCTGDALYEEAGDIEPCDFTKIYDVIRGIQKKHPAPSKTRKTDGSAVAASSSVQIETTGTAITTKYDLFMHGTAAGDKPTVVFDDFGNSLTYPDRSAADMGLCNVLAIKYGDKPDSIWEDYAASCLCRDKWLKRESDFRRLTIANAVKWSASADDNAKASAMRIIATPAVATEIVTERASQVELKTIKWLWENRIPFGKLTVFGGNPDQGKSLVTMYVAAQLTVGAPLEGSSVELPPCEVLVMAGEDDAADTIVPRLKSMGADLDKIHLVESITVNSVGATREEREVQLDTDIKEIDKLLAKFPEIRLIVIDPVSNYLGRVNMNREQEVRSILIPLKVLAARRGISIIAVMHLNKNSEASAIHRIGGAMVFSGVARAAWMFISDTVDKDVHQMLRIKKNIGSYVGGLKYKIGVKTLTINGEDTEQPHIVWLGATDDTADDVLVKGQAGRPAEERESAKDWLIEFLSEGEQTAEDIFYFGKKAGHCQKTLRRAKDDIGAFSYQEGRKWCWKFKVNGVEDYSAIEVDE